MPRKSSIAVCNGRKPYELLQNLLAPEKAPLKKCKENVNAMAAYLQPRLLVIIIPQKINPAKRQLHST